MLTQWIGTLFQNKQTKTLDQLVTAYTNLNQFSGAALVAHRGEVLLRKGYGMANWEHNRPNRPESVFRIGSMTKPFTAIAIMQLVEQGKLSTTTPINTFLPTFPQGEQITVHHLLSNRSGIPDYVLTPEYRALAKQPITAAELIARFQNRPLLFAPGTDFNYSNLNWVILGYLLEQTTGKPYATVIEEQILQPAGMKLAGYAWEQPIIPGRAQGYIDTGEKMLNAELIDETTMQGAGGLYATVDDLYGWAQALQKQRLVQAETLQQMIQPISQPVDGQGYGYGWELHTSHQRNAFGHSGGLPGYVSNFLLLPSAQAAIIILSNLGSASVAQLSEGMAAILLGEPYAMPSARSYVQVDPAVLAIYAGKYTLTFFGRTSILTFAVENDRLTLEVSGLPKTVCSALTETTFYARSKGDVELTFVRAVDGSVPSIAVNWSGHQLTATRLTFAAPA
jgi:CubicO group peptidase (beta-lactamase class C family)